MENPDYVADLAIARDRIKLANDLAGLQSDERFQRVFGDHFIEAFAVTNTMLMASYDQATRQRTIEKMIARSHFTQFMEGVITDGIQAVQAVDEISALQREEETIIDEESDEDLDGAI